MGLQTIHNTNENTVESIRLSKRDQLILQRINEGRTYRQIAVEVGIQESGISKAVKRALRAIVAPEADTLRKTHMSRLELMWENIMPAILEGDVNAIRTGVLLLKRQAVMFGIDAPVQMSVKRVTEEYADKFGLDEDERVMLFTALRDELSRARETGARELAEL